MTKRLALLFAVATIAVLLVPALAFANMYPHGNYLKDTDECAGCHRAHTSVSTVTWQDRTLTTKSALLVSSARNLYEFCYTCHDATSQGAVTNVEEGIYEDPSSTNGTYGAILNGGGFKYFGDYSLGEATKTTSTHIYTGAPWGAYGGGYTGKGTVGADGLYTDPTDPLDAAKGQSVQLQMDCATCHDPHGSANYRLLKSLANGNYVGGYVPSGDPENPDPDPWVWSNEENYPAGGFELHSPATGYKPNYTTPLYVKGYNVNASTGGENATKGMSGWCVGCHSTYMTPKATYDKSNGTTYTAMAWTYDAADGGGLKLRHKHPINIPLSNYKGPDAASMIVTDQVLPLAHDFAGTGSNGTTTTSDWVECLTCHRAHGTAVTMTGFASAEGARKVVGTDGLPHNVFPGDESALLRLDNRSVCQECHNK